MHPTVDIGNHRFIPIGEPVEFGADIFDADILVNKPANATAVMIQLLIGEGYFNFWGAGLVKFRFPLLQYPLVISVLGLSQLSISTVGESYLVYQWGKA